MRVFRVLKLAYYLFRLELACDGDFAVTYSPAANRWRIGYEGDLFAEWLEGSSLTAVLQYFLRRKIR